MTCKCGETGVYNEVNFKSFYYCRSCKIEIELEVVDPWKYNIPDYDRELAEFNLMPF